MKDLRRSATVVGLCLICLLEGSAQDSLKQSNNDYFQSNWNVKAGLSNYLYWDYPSFLVGVEYFLTDQFSVFLEGGKNLPITSEEIGRLKDGNEFGGEGRIYFQRDVSSSFIGFRFQHRSMTIQDRFTLGYECDGVAFRNCVYYADFPGDMKTRFYGYQIIGGTQLLIGKRTGVDLYGGIGRLNRVLDKTSVNGGDIVRSSGMIDEAYFTNLGYVSIKIALFYKL
ncbi:MAG: DUF3575 domain-containing protein [Bacteroidota bacterium]